MKLKVHALKVQASKFIVFLHEDDAKKLKVHSGDRVKISYNQQSIIGLVDILSNFLKEGEVALSDELLKRIGSHAGSLVDISLVATPSSAFILQTKISHKPYTRAELKKIIQDIVSNALTEAEIAYFVSGIYHYGFSIEETINLTKAIFETGERLTWGKQKVADKHSIGGIPGNRTTPILVSICAAAGVLMPKTSSRAITSGAGTADAVESVAQVALSIKELKQVVRKTGACLVWGGALGLAPADDKLIQIEKILNLDPEPQLLASILAKKLAVGSTHVLIDIPYGSGAKVSKKMAEALRHKFLLIGKRLGLKIKVILTDGSQPIGNGIGPMLEIHDVLRVLRCDNSPRDLEKKSIMLAGLLLETLGKAKKGEGKKRAHELLESGAALQKFKEIIEAQHGSLDLLRVASFHRVMNASRTGKISKIDNKKINALARITGCPQDKAAGLYIHSHKPERVSKGEPLITLYTESQYKLREAAAYYIRNQPIIIT